VQASGATVEYGLDPLVVGKLSKSKVEPLFHELEFRKLDLIASRLRLFVEDVHKSQIASREQWEQFLTSHGLPKQMDLNIDNYLKNFDSDNSLTRELIVEINETKVTDKDGKVSSLKEGAIRWLTKLDFRPIGCFTDVVNLTKINGELPSILMMDAEGDDDGVLSLLNKYHQEKGTKLRVVVQLPTDKRADRIANEYAGLGYEILRDSESRNIEALLRTHADLVNFTIAPIPDNVPFF
jgi:hypothetical protein